MHTGFYRKINLLLRSISVIYSNRIQWNYRSRSESAPNLSPFPYSTGSLLYYAKSKHYWNVHSERKRVSKALLAKVTVFTTNVLSIKIRSRQRPKVFKFQ